MKHLSAVQGRNAHSRFPTPSVLFCPCQGESCAMCPTNSGILSHQSQPIKGEKGEPGIGQKGELVSYVILKSGTVFSY